MGAIRARLSRLIPVWAKRAIRRVVSPRVRIRSAAEGFETLDHHELASRHGVDQVVLADAAGGSADRRLIVYTRAVAPRPAARREQDRVVSLGSLRLDGDSRSHGWHVPLELAPVDRSGPYNFKIYYPNLNLLLNEVPKNASSTIKTTLLAIDREGRVNEDYVRYTPHEAWQAAFPEHRVDWSTFPWQCAFRFAFQRNPYDRVVSAYKNAGWTNHYGDMPFATFVASLPELLEAPLDDLVAIHLKPFFTFVPSVDGSPYLDFLGKVENFNTDFRTLLDAAGVGDVARLPRINTSDHNPYREYYDDQSRQTVARLYADDLELGQYTF